MKKRFLLAALPLVAAAAAIGSSAGAGPSVSASLTAREHGGSALVREAVVFQRSVPVGRVSAWDRWKCISKTGDTVYFTTGDIESRARRVLEAVVQRRVHCYEVRPLFLAF